MNEISHKPVMPDEVMGYISGIHGIENGIVADCTLGEGGHSEMILRKFEDIRVIGIEKDKDILERAKKRLNLFKERIEFVNIDFSEIASHLEEQKNNISAFLYDFGISTYHYEQSGRGFSFSRNEPLDMRLGPAGDNDAASLINGLPEKELALLFWKYGEERWSKRIARRIVEYRAKKPVETSLELAELVARSIPGKFHGKKIHPATRVFQALRIAVNDELDSIERSLKSAFGLLGSGGRIIAISFHSLEDRIVKNFFRRMARGCTCNEEAINCICSRVPLLRMLTKKPVIPGETELNNNLRARSAKLRACEKI